MKIIYAGTDTQTFNTFKASGEDGIVLLWDRWDDYDYKTTCPTYCRINATELDLGPVKILFGEQYNSHPYLEAEVNKGWDRNFPLPNAEYISVTSSTDFYEKIVEVGGVHRAIRVAKALNDASYMRENSQYEWVDKLISSRGFSNSLLRERGARRAYEENIKFILGRESNIADMSFAYLDAYNQQHSLRFLFSGDSDLPQDINVLIGPNGLGKSRLLHQIVEAWLTEDTPGVRSFGFEGGHSFSQVIVASYSPFELFPVDLQDANKPELMDVDIYKYFGLRERIPEGQVRDKDSIWLSRNRPKIDAANSVISALIHDVDFSSLSGWPKKLEIMEIVLNDAVSFDFMALRLKEINQVSELIRSKVSSEIFMPKDSGVEYLRVSSKIAEFISIDELHQIVDFNDGVSFVSGEGVVGLSSGQKLFSYIVINILGSIRKDSLILVDEPELFLHPALEVRFISMLKDVLSVYQSRAILATHSVVTVREVPARCVHIFNRTDGAVFISKPPFETFAGDVQRIASYVFDDRNSDKPHEATLKRGLNKYGTAREFIRALGGNINEEVIIQINAMEKGKW